MQIDIAAYPDLNPVLFTTSFPTPLERPPSPAWLVDLLRLEADAPVGRSEALRTAVRDLLRHAGYKPTGRGKPASEYLVRAAENKTLGSINAVVDACNAVSLHSGFPISVIDLDLSTAPWSVRPADANDHYVFNPSGQEINVGGLLCLFDADGPCANAVKDAQRTKTSTTTSRTLTVMWGLEAFTSELEEAFRWYAGILERLDAKVDHIA
jgi:DNA/RNA-binding domain of Phe-tRNA-synthetase-like protein